MFIDVQTVLAIEFYELINVMEEVQKKGFWSNPLIFFLLIIFFFHVMTNDCCYLGCQPNWDVNVYNDP